MGCPEMTKTGAPCQAPARFADGRCLYHSDDPLAAELRRQGQSAGGRATGKVRHLQSLKPLKSPREMLKRCEELYALLLSGELGPKTVQAATKLLAEAREAYALVLLEHRLREALRGLDTPVIEGVHEHDERGDGDGDQKAGTTR